MPERGFLSVSCFESRRQRAWQSARPGSHPAYGNGHGSGQSASVPHAMVGDAYNLACLNADGRQVIRRDAANCPTPNGPDVDFGIAPILVRLGDRDQLVVGQKTQLLATTMKSMVRR